MQFILCMPPGHSGFKQRYTKELCTNTSYVYSHTRAHIPSIVQQLYVSVREARAVENNPNLNQIPDTHTDCRLYPFTQELRTRSLRVSAHPGPWPFNEGAESKEIMNSGPINYPPN